jgi:hypothetical protein
LSELTIDFVTGQGQPAALLRDPIQTASLLGEQTSCSGVRPMIETGAYGERIAGYLHLAEPPIYAAPGYGRSELAVTRLHARDRFTDPTSAIPLEKAFSTHLHLRANHRDRLWFSCKLVPTSKRPSGGVTSDARFHH